MTESQETFEAIRTEWLGGGLERCLNGTDVWPMYDISKPGRVERWQHLDEPDKALETCTMDCVDWAVARTLGVSIQSLHMNRRAKHIAQPRQLAMFLMSKHCTKRTLKEIGRHFNDMDHTTVMYAIRRMKKLLADDPDWLATHDRAQDMLAGLAACKDKPDDYPQNPHYSLDVTQDAPTPAGVK